MQAKQVLSFLGLGILLLTAVIMGGCSEPFDEAGYQVPNWTPEGLIYCQKSVTHYRREPMGTVTLGTDYYYVTMDTDGNNEITLPYNSYPFYSPKGTYVALISGETISIIRRSDNNKVYDFSPTTGSISLIDWGPNDDKLAFMINSSGHLFVVNVDGSNLKEIAAIDAIEFSWKHNAKILCFDSSSGTSYLTFVNPESASIESTSFDHSLIGSYLNYYSDGNYIFSAGNSRFYKIDAALKNIVSETTHELSNINPKSWINAKLSP
jgi:hypothetical protein